MCGLGDYCNLNSNSGEILGSVHSVYVTQRLIVAEVLAPHESRSGIEKVNLTNLEVLLSDVLFRLPSSKDLDTFMRSTRPKPQLIYTQNYEEPLKS